MRIDSVSEENKSNPWEVYENYRKTLTVKKEDLAAPVDSADCQTCKSRKYQDGSNDPGVSFKTPTQLDPTQAASAVRGHEMEHVGRNQAEAKRENRRVVSQSVTYHNAICPECGSVYISGGTTRTVTKGENEPQDSVRPLGSSKSSGFDRYA